MAQVHNPHGPEHPSQTLAKYTSYRFQRTHLVLFPHIRPHGRIHQQPHSQENERVHDRLILRRIPLYA